MKNKKEVLIEFTKYGMCLMSDVAELINTIGSKDVTVIKKNKGDSVVEDFYITPKIKEFLVFTQNGFIQRIKLNEISEGKRGESGKIITKLSMKTGHIVEVMPITKKNINIEISNRKLSRIIKIKTVDIPLSKLRTPGVKMFELLKGEKITSIN